MSLPRNARKLLIAALSVVAFFGLLELGLRLGGFRYPPTDEPITIWNRLEDRDLRLGLGLHRSEARTLWGPRPGAEIPKRWSPDEKVNAHGWRGRELPLEKSSGVLRIATLGDSSTFGYGVGYADTYSAQLQELLTAQGIACEVLDAGVVGYTIRQGLERYKRLVRDYKPDIVIEAFGAVNDHHQAQGGIADRDKIESDAVEQGLWTELCVRIRHDLLISHFMVWLVDELQGGKGDERNVEFTKELKEFRLSKHVGRVEFDRVGKRRVPLADFKAALLELRDAVEADGGRLVLLSMPRQQSIEDRAPVLTHYSRLLLELGLQQQLPLADGRKQFRIALREGREEKELFVPNDAYHPSRAGHALLAAELARVIGAMLPLR